MASSAGQSRAVGSHFLFDGAMYDEYASDGTFMGPYPMNELGTPYPEALPYGAGTVMVDDRSSPLAAYPLTWTLPRSFQRKPLANLCDRFEVMDLTTIAGRPAREIRCRQLLDAWIDTGTAQLLRVNWGGGDLAEATAINLPPTLDPGLFEHLTAMPDVRRLWSGLMAPGRYVSTPFVPEIDFQLGVGWVGYPVLPDGGTIQLGLTEFSFGRPSFVVDPATGADTAVPADAASFVDWLRGHPGLMTTVPEPITIGGAPGYRVSISVRDGASTEPCPNLATTRCVLLTTMSNGEHGMIPAPALVEMLVLDVHGQVVLLSMLNDDGTLPTLDLTPIVSFP